MNTLSPENRQEWRAWLALHHHVKQMIWLVCSKKNAARSTIMREEAVDEALCYGWIDGTTRPLDADRYLQSFTKRKPRSVWCKANKEKADQLIRDGLMTQAGLDSIAIAKGNGYWSILDEVEALIIPKDLKVAWRKNPKARDHFSGLGRSDKKRLLQWLVLAKRPETREQRIREIVTCGEKGIKPKQFI